MSTLVDLAITETNTAYASSGITQRLNLVYKGEVVYPESGRFNTDLSRLRATSDGFMDEVHALRDTCRADLVSLIVTGTIAAAARASSAFDANGGPARATSIRVADRLFLVTQLGGSG